MGRDNSPKERQQRQLERKQNRRASYDRILIVSEGEKTEPNYFGEIRHHYRLHTANVQVLPSALGTTPIQVVNHAEAVFKKGDRHLGIQPRAFEHVFAVFDRDDHRTYHEALAHAQALDGQLRNDLRQPVRFAAIPSRPDFELWLLLHFEDVRAPLHRDDAVARLRRHLPGYQKGSDQTFAATRSALPVATQRARALMQRAGPFDDPEPYTGVVDLVALLTGLRE